MVRSSSRKRRSTSNSSGDGSASKRSKDKRGCADEDKENVTFGEMEREEEGIEPEGEDEDVDADEEDAFEGQENDDEEGDEDEKSGEDKDDDDEEEEGMDTSATAARGRKKSSARPGKSAEAGIIQTVYCENFMCHRKLRVVLNRNVNFIHGQNGSGKSAVLAAIQICLGAGARRTHRARNLKDLVRKDSTASAMPSGAKIRVTLLNQGSDSYKHDVYGDTITVERTISLKGGYNGYKLLDHKGVEKSRSKKDLDDMLDTLNIQVENPVAVLDQEEAKKFLMGKAEDKYNFFMKATELERVDRTYASTVDTIVELDATNERIKESLKTLHDHVDDLKKKWQEHQELGKLESKYLKFSTEYAWSIFNEQDKSYNTAVENMEKTQEKARQKKEELRQAEEAAGTPGNDGESKRNRVDQLLQEAQSQAQLKRGLEEELKEAMVPYKNAERNLGAVKKKQSSAAKQLKAAKQRLQEARDQIMSNADSAESEEARRTALLKKSEETLASARAKVDELKQDQSKWLRSYEEIEPHVRDSTSKVDRLKKQLQGVQHTLRSLQSSSGRDSLALLGPRVATVAQMVEKAKTQNKFRGDVTGPIGCFIKVAPGMDEFASVAELALGIGVLDRFIVTNDHDNSVMRDIRKQANCGQDCGVFQIHPSGRYRIPPPPEVEGIETVASVLVIDNDIVFNCLVDNARIEQKAVARDRLFSERELLVTNGGQNAIRGGKIKEVFCLPKGDQWTVKGGAIAIFSNDKTLRQTIGVDKSAAVADAQAEEAQMKEAIQAMQQEESKLQHEHTTYQKEWNRAKKAVQQNDSLISDLTEKIDSIKDDMEASANVTIDTTEYEEDVQQAEEVVDRLKGDEQKLLADKENLLPHINEVKSRLDECAMRNGKVLGDIKAAENDLTQFLETQTQQNDQIEKKRQKLLNYQNAVSTYENAIEERSAAREKSLKKARTMHFRWLLRAKADETAENSSVPQNELRMEPTDKELDEIEPIVVKNEPKYYELRMKKIKDKIQKERECRNVSREDPAAVFERYSQAKSDLAARAAQVEKTDARIVELQKDVNQRRKRWQQFRKHLSKSTGMKFDEMLSLNKYSGNLDFNHETLKLDLAVQKNTAESKSETKDVKALSGGERSYTTMCLLLALGETLETPFRILDEFDVFLDAEVRKLTIKSLIHVAKTMKHRQFIFITPQDLSSITPDNELKILKMNPPDRHQNAGGPSQQTLPFASQE